MISQIEISNTLTMFPPEIAKIIAAYAKPPPQPHLKFLNDNCSTPAPETNYHIQGDQEIFTALRDLADGVILAPPNCGWAGVRNWRMRKILHDLRWNKAYLDDSMESEGEFWSWDEWK